MKTANWPPLLFFSGALCLVFLSICYVTSLVLLWLLSLFSTFGVFFEVVFHFVCIRQKKECSPNWFGWPKQITSSQSTCIRNEFAFSIVCGRSFLILVVLILRPFVACLCIMKVDRHAFVTQLGQQLFDLITARSYRVV